MFVWLTNYRSTIDALFHCRDNIMRWRNEKNETHFRLCLWNDVLSTWIHKWCCGIGPSHAIFHRSCSYFSCSKMPMYRLHLIIWMYHIWTSEAINLEASYFEFLRSTFYSLEGGRKIVSTPFKTANSIGILALDLPARKNSMEWNRFVQRWTSLSIKQLHFVQHASRTTWSLSSFWFAVILNRKKTCYRNLSSGCTRT